MLVYHPNFTFSPVVTPSSISSLVFYPEGNSSIKNLIALSSHLIYVNATGSNIPINQSAVQKYINIDSSYSYGFSSFTNRVTSNSFIQPIQFELDTLDSYVKATYPDLRKCLNLLQMNSVDNKLKAPSETGTGTADYKLAMVDLFKHGKIREARKLLCDQARPEEMEEIFRWLYDNLEMWSKSEEGQDEAILIIRKGLVNHVSCADAEINLSATLVELSQIAS
jgi:hypothetical protein